MITQNKNVETPKFIGDETAKKVFVEPEISEPVDVLEATAFFQVIVGQTNPLES